jgi:hypothetical protein
VGAIAAIFALYAVLGVTRGGVDPEVASNPRFTYETGVLVLVGIAALVGPIRPPANRRRTRLIALVGTLVVIALAFNLRLLIDGRELMLERADLTRALITVALDPNRPSGVDPNRSLVVVPSPASLEQVVARYGSPLGDRLVQDSVRPIPSDTLAEARQWLIEGPPPKIGGG